MSLDRVRAEIKAWERDFASTHGRDPSVQDIRDQPHIAEKYKLYKKLTKTRSANPNPVSPVKRTNPFATPSKNNTATPSPQPSHSTPNASSSCDLPVPTTAVSRARKRLRGEPVSPSPNKPKRQRIHAHALPPFPKLDQDSSNSEYEADQELPQCNFTSSFVADSPVKAPAGGKSFKLLFDDVLPALAIPKQPIDSPIALSDPPPDTSFARAFAGPLVTASRTPTSTGVISRPEHRGNRAYSNIFPTKDHAVASTFATAISGVLHPQTSTKRTLDIGDPVDEHTALGIPLQSQCPLIPPSPPPQDLVNRDTSKGRGKPITSRKKSRVENEGSDQGWDSSDDVSFKVATVTFDQDEHACRHADDLDWDPLLHPRTFNHDPAAERQMDANRHAAGTFSVDLPDKFRRVLAISPSQSRNGTEERVVRGLLYGDRVGHYDPSRGGDIWDAGEMDDIANEDVETEDDWEGEPVPWEIGEL